MAVTEEAVLEVLGTVVDPELHRSLTELDMVKELRIDGGSVYVKVNLTIQGCPLKFQIQEDIENKIKALDGVDSVQVEFGAMTDAERAAVAAKVRGTQPAQEPPHILRPGSPTRIIGVSSGKGGVGKSTATVNLALALKHLGYRVGVIDCDIYGFSIPRMLGNMGRPALLGENTILPMENHGIFFISAGSLVDEDTPIIWRGPMLGKLLEQFLRDVQWPELDYLLLDLPPGTGDMALSIAQMMPASDLVIVTTPQQAATRVASRVGAMAQKTQQRVLGIIENMAYFICDGCDKRHYIFGTGGAEQLAQALNCPVLAEIPLTGGVREGGDAGVPIMVSGPDSPAAAAFVAAARSLAEVAPPAMNLPVTGND